MRVIAGSARRLLLKTIEGMDTRPTTDRIKETLFNMLNTLSRGAEISNPDSCSSRSLLSVADAILSAI